MNEANSRDWLRPGHCGEGQWWTVPFAQILRRSRRGADRILLGNGTYFSLRRPGLRPRPHRGLANSTTRAAELRIGKSPGGAVL